MRPLRQTVSAIGYDPGGKGKNGVALTRIDIESGDEIDREVHVIKSPRDATQWLVEHAEEAEVFAVDTMMAWQFADRPCDQWIRKNFVSGRSGVKVSTIGSLQGSMLSYGLIAARTVLNKKPNLTLAEANPKPLRRALGYDDLQEDDHGEDAWLAALAAGQWAAGQWKRDLFSEFPSDYWYPAGAAVYPWPD